MQAILGPRDDKHIPNQSGHEYRQRIVNPRLALNRHQLLAHSLRERPQPPTCAVGQDAGFGRHDLAFR